MKTIATEYGVCCNPYCDANGECITDLVKDGEKAYLICPICLNQVDVTQEEE